MKIKILPSIFFIFFLIIFYIFYKGLQNSSIYTPKVGFEKEIPSFEAQILDTNNKINSDKIFEQDKFYLMNIWASWCVPCRDEHFYLMSLNKQKDITIVGINYKDKIENAKKFLKELGNPYKFILLDNDGTIAIEWGSYGVPETYLIYNKKVLKKFIGPLNENRLSEMKKLIK